MTNSQVGTAAARCWIDPETRVRKPGTDVWTKLADALPDQPRITEEKVVADIGTSAMLVLSGEFEVVSDGDAPLTDGELAVARPPRLAPRLLALALLMMAGGAALAHRYAPNLDARARSMIASMHADFGPAPSTPAVTVAVAAPVTAAKPPAPPTVTSSATMQLLPKMREPSPPKPLATQAKVTKSESTKAKKKRRSGRP